ncbi:MAG: GIY-YIG nuclease family protein [Alphaproteobacteria bacterium]
MVERDFLYLTAPTAPPAPDADHVMRGGRRAAEFLAKRAEKVMRRAGLIGELPADIMASLLCITVEALDELHLPHTSLDRETGERLWTYARTAARFDDIPRHFKEHLWVPPRVYFIRVAGNGPIKIGVAKNVDKRASGIQTHHARPVRVLATEPGGRRREQQLHEKFASIHVRGEWFKAAPQLLRYIEDAANWQHPRAKWERGRGLGRSYG